MEKKGPDEWMRDRRENVLVFQATRLHERHLPEHRLQGVPHLPHTVRGGAREQEGERRTSAGGFSAFSFSSRCTARSPRYTARLLSSYAVLCALFTFTAIARTCFLKHVLAVSRLPLPFRILFADCSRDADRKIANA